MAALLSKTEIPDTYASSSWQRVIFAEFEATLTSTARPFPCVFGVTGHKADQIRYAFPDPFDAESIGALLTEYLAGARDLGRMTSLVLFARPGPVQHIESYRQRFWHLLDDLERQDTTPRPAGVARELDDPSWEFCYAGEPIFVVCNSPAHVLRQSRRSSSFMVTFQPRWVFEGITDSDTPAARRALENVRQRLADFDAIPTAPYLGAYGESQNREFRQYFIDDSNATPTCPFHRLGAPNTDAVDTATDTEEGKVA